MSHSPSFVYQLKIVIDVDFSYRISSSPTYSMLDLCANLLFVLRELCTIDFDYRQSFAVLRIDRGVFFFIVKSNAGKTTPNKTVWPNG